MERTQDDRLNLALAAARLGDFHWDAKTDVVTLSPRAADIFGIPPGPHMTWTAMRQQLLHADDRESARAAVERALSERGDYSLEYRLVNADRERWVVASGRGQYAEDGAALGMIGVVQDITRDRLLVRLDDAVRPLASSEDITYTAARVLGQHLAVNRCAYAFVEPDEDTFILTGNYNHGVESIVGRYRFRQFSAECLRLMRAGEPWVIADSEADPRIEDEDRAAYRLTAIRAVICVPILKAGHFVAAMAVHAKSTRGWSSSEVELVQQVASRCWESIERAKVERERAALLAAAESANRTKDEFLAMLGHELRNPLAPILTALQIMKLRGDTTSERERTIIERQVSHLGRLVDDLLDVARITRGQVELKEANVDLADVVAHAVEVASPLLEERAHVVVVDVERGLVVRGDPARLTQVFSNLLTNAGKYTPPGGRITVGAHVDGADIVARVSDTGVGIAPEIMPQIFDRFVQGRQSLDRAQGGLGLGLSIVKSLVERHGGQVSAHSDGVGKGAAITVRLPRLEGPAAPAERPVPAARSIALKVLVVDDNEDAAELLSVALEMKGCVVRVAHDGPAALAVAANETFDAALLDIGLPVMDGYELVARLRELTTCASTRLVAVTGYGQEADRKRALAAGFQEHLVKPVDLAVLEGMLASLARAR